MLEGSLTRQRPSLWYHIGGGREIFGTEDLGRRFGSWDAPEESLTVVGEYSSLQTFHIAGNFRSQVKTQVTASTWLDQHVCPWQDMEARKFAITHAPMFEAIPPIPPLPITHLLSIRIAAPIRSFFVT